MSGYTSSTIACACSWDHWRIAQIKKDDLEDVQYLRDFRWVESLPVLEKRLEQEEQSSSLPPTFLLQITQAS